MVEAVPSELERAVGNLLDNAAKWSPPQGVVEVSVGEGQVVVRDHGPGIAAGRPAPRLRPLLPRVVRARHARARVSAWRSCGASPTPTAAR